MTAPKPRNRIVKETAPEPTDQTDQTDLQSSGTVTVRVVGQAVGEGKVYHKGETFETTPDRAAALGSLVEVVK